MTVLDEWADALKKRGVKRIDGNLYYYDRALDDQWTHPSWSRGYITEWYAAPISGLNFNNNCVDIKVLPTGPGEPLNFTVVPPTQNVSFRNKAVTGKGDEPDVGRERDKDVFIITGATTRPRELKSEAVTNPGAFFADALRTHLKEKGIDIAGDTIRADKPLGGKAVPPADKVVATHETKLADGLSRVNKQSQNNFAEGYAKLLGRGYRAKQGNDEPGSWPAGAEATKAFLAKNRIDASQVVIADGSGLSRENRVTSRMISDLLRTMWRHRHKQPFFDSLSISGTDGTISARMKDLKGRVHAKTGFIGGVRSLSGYVQHDDGRWIVFSIIYNGIDGSVKPFEDRQDNAVRTLAAWPKAATLSPVTRPTTERTNIAGGGE
jgi:D-alanyl-D-alanine carboxypeptidase/D-alanyl-D-alanine-endopeptidase (penicillin-binding protein 4)